MNTGSSFTPGRHLHGGSRTGRIPEVRRLEHRSLGRSAAPRGYPDAGGKPATTGRSERGRRSGGNHEYAVGNGDRRKEHRQSAAERTQLHRPAVHTSGRGAHKRDGRARADLRERAAPGIQFVPGKWRRRERGPENDCRSGAEPGLGGRIPPDHQFLRRRVRPLQRGRNERHHQIGNQRRARRGIRVSTQQQYGCARLFRPRGDRAQAQPVRLRGGRTRTQEQVVLVHRLSGDTRTARYVGQPEPVAERRSTQRHLQPERPEWRSERPVLGAGADQASGLRRVSQ